MCGLLFYKIPNKAIAITANVSTQIQFKNCTFILNQCVYIESLISIVMQAIYKDITFLNYKFYQNDFWVI